MDRFEALPEEKEAFFSNRRGALAGKAAADIKGWKVGDLVSIPTFSEKNDGSNVWEFVIEGIYTTNPAADELGIMVRNEYVEEARIANKGTVSMIMFNLDDPSKADEVSNIIDNNYKNSAYATFTGNEITLSQKMLSDIGDIKLIITAIISAVFFTLLLVTANTMSQSVRERTSDLAILKSLGYKDGQIFISILLESNFIILIGASLGLMLTLITMPFIDQASGGLTGGIIVFDFYQVIRGILIGVLMASLAGILPAYQAYKLKVVDALAKG
jgi:putative ABC transport system permease protein